MRWVSSNNSGAYEAPLDVAPVSQHKHHYIIMGKQYKLLKVIWVCPKF